MIDSVEYIRRQIAAMRRQVAHVMKDTTDEQFNWQPPGTANTIGATFLHLNCAEDSYFNWIIQGKPRIWEADHWDEKTGINPPPIRGDWSGVVGKHIPLDAVLAFEQAVCTATESYLAALTADELERRVMFVGGEQAVADVLTTFVVHNSSHSGEIAALKGAQGLKGLPF